MEYRQGAIGALTDEYEKALKEIKDVINSIPEVTFLKEVNSKEDDFKSIRNITLHIIRSGYSYSNYVRKWFNEETTSVKIEVNTTEECIIEIEKMLLYHIKTYENKWLMSDDEMMKTIIKTSWTTYDLEAIIEHAIVHILRHRLQIQKLLKSI
jgi:uncharacterized damage-inducible protein DinB